MSKMTTVLSRVRKAVDQATMVRMKGLRWCYNTGDVVIEGQRIGKSVAIMNCCTYMGQEAGVYQELGAVLVSVFVAADGESVVIHKGPEEKEFTLKTEDYFEDTLRAFLEILFHTMEKFYKKTADAVSPTHPQSLASYSKTSGMHLQMAAQAVNWARADYEKAPAKLKDSIHSIDGVVHFMRFMLSSGLSDIALVDCVSDMLQPQFRINFGELMLIRLRLIECDRVIRESKLKGLTNKHTSLRTILEHLKDGN